MVKRGQIAYPNRARQLRDFSGLRYGNITPTDIDLFIDFGGKLLVIGEAKLEGRALPYGQRLALERWIDTQIIPSYALVFEHNTQTHEVIEVDSCRVVEYRVNRRWDVIRQNITMKQAVDRILLRCGLGVYLGDD